MRSGAPHPILDATADIAQLTVSQSVEPFLLTNPRGVSAHALNARLASLYDLSPESVFTLRQLSEDGEPNERAIDLTASDRLPPGFSGDFLLHVGPPSISIDACYDALRDSRDAVPPGLAAERFFRFLSRGREPDPYLLPLFLHRFLHRALLDLVRAAPSPLARSLLAYFADDALQDFRKRDIVKAVLMGVFSVVIGDAVLWGKPCSPSVLPEWPTLIRILVGMIVRVRINGRYLRKAVSAFRPSAISEELPIAIVSELRRTTSDAELFCIVSDLFPDSFMWHCFADDRKLSHILNELELVSMFPFLAVRCCMRDVLAKRIDVRSAIAIITQLGIAQLAFSRRIANAILEPLFDDIYNGVLNNPLPFLEMSDGELRRIVDEILTPMIPIMRATIVNSRDVQLCTLIALQKLLAKRGFEPKGLCFVWYAFLYDRRIVHDTVFAKFCNGSRIASPGQSSVILEINSFLLSLIPGPLPDLNRDSHLPPKRPYPSWPTIPR
jgi:hypothetical protein